MQPPRLSSHRAWAVAEPDGVIPPSVSGGHRARFSFCRFPPSTVETGKHRYHEAGIHVHGSFQEHGALAFVTRSHKIQVNTDPRL